ncbi:hypothetical protein UA08_02333 [Talaromyces atroroseus]|uniref:Xylanolytic transcriptional activator regulatory domain-containing protein n=1 Tax=Talaromyces atroroseus TaxID=1441469 RepID=A0A225B4D6_TALAT|nr:hypothetical protein UA08_02333 [Talaromyces atroroseus]OKL61715.1 hypothetical protein UA08_02333 [Talaromyces atroroseus]
MQHSSIETNTPPESGEAGPTSLQPSGLLNSNAIRNGQFSLLSILGDSDKTPGQEQETPVISTEDPIQMELIGESIAIFLFESFINVLNPYISQLDPILHTFTYTRRTSSFLLSSVLAVSAKMFNPALYKPLLKHAEDLFAESFRRGAKSTEIAQAILILTYWKEPDDTRTWLNLGYVIRMGMDLGWHRLGLRPRYSVARPSETEVRKARNEERTWFVLFVYDRSISLQTGKPWMIERNTFIEAIQPWCRDPLAIKNDVLLGAFVTLRLLTSEVFMLLGSRRQMNSPRMTSFLTMISNRINEWEDKWLPLCHESDSCHYFLVRFYGAHLRLQLYALPLQEVLNSNDEHNITYHLETLWASLSSAVSMLKLVSQYASRLYFAQDSVHVMTAYSAAFLIKVLLSAPAHITRDFEPTVVETIRTASATLSQQSAPVGSSCSLQRRFLSKVLSNYDEIVKRRTNLKSNQMEDAAMPDSGDSRNSNRNNNYSDGSAAQYDHNTPSSLIDMPGISSSLQFSNSADDNAQFLGFSERMDRNLVENAWADVFTAAGFTVQDGFPFND